MNNKTSKVITGVNTRWSYVNVIEPRAGIDGQNPKYSISLIIPKSDTETIQKIKDAIKVAYQEGKNKLGKNAPALEAIKTPLRDGDLERAHDKAYKDSYFINANAIRKPGIVDENVEPIIDSSEIYSGCYGRASISFYAYNFNGNRGIACGINNLQKIRDGKPLGGNASAESDFASLKDDFLD